MGKANNWVILAKVKAPGQQAKFGQQCEGSASPQELCVLSKPEDWLLTEPQSYNTQSPGALPSSLPCLTFLLRRPREGNGYKRKRDPNNCEGVKLP